MREGTGGAATNRSVFEITDYALTDEEVRSVRAQLRKYRTGPAQVVVFGLLEALQNLRLTQPLAWVTQHAGSVRSVLGLK